VRRYAELLLVVFAASSGVSEGITWTSVATGLAMTAAAALSVFARLHVAHINFFLLFAHMTFLRLVF
jgi:hypothetical protein